MGRMGNRSAHKPRKPYVGDVGAPLDAPAKKASAGFGMVVFSLAVGFAVGMVVWAVFWASSALTELLWVDACGALAGLLARAGLPSWWLPVAFCTTGGVAIGLWTARLGGAPEPLEHVMATVKETGGYKLDRPLASVVGFLLPLVFGGSIGPEAGLTGIIAAACTRVGTALKAAGLRIKGVADLTVSAALSAVFATPLVGIVATVQDGMPRVLEGDAEGEAYEFRRAVKLVVYTASALGAVAGIVVFTWLFGAEGGMPRFEGITPEVNELWWAVPCLLAGYVGALLYHGAQTAFSQISMHMGDHPVAKPVIAGAVLGTLAIPLPYVLFPGEAQSFELMENWQQLAPALLVATGLVKCLVTPLCLNFGWRGGHFFPCIFAGIAIGYGIAGASGIDPMFCVAITTATLVAGVQRKPLVALALLLLCFPAKSMVWMGIACLIGATAPMPACVLRTGRAESVGAGYAEDLAEGAAEDRAERK